MHYHNRNKQLEGKTFDTILRTYPERRLKLPPFKSIMTQARRTKPMPRIFVRNYAVAAAARTDALALDYSELLVLMRPLRAYMVGYAEDTASARPSDLRVIGNVTLPAGVLLQECVAKSPWTEAMVPGFEVHTVDADSYVSLDLHFRHAYQRGGMYPPGHTSGIYLGPQMSPPGTTFTVFLDQGNALLYAGVKTMRKAKEKPDAAAR